MVSRMMIMLFWGLGMVFLISSRLRSTLVEIILRLRVVICSLFM